jgi:hypothetical protein
VVVARCLRNAVVQFFRAKTNPAALGEVRFFARVRSENGDAAGFEIHGASISIGPSRFPVVEQKVSLSTGNLRSLGPIESEAAISIALDGSGLGAVKGDAAIGAVSVPTRIIISQNRKSLEASSRSDFWAKVRVKTQGDTGLEYVDLLFGKKGQPEEHDEKGIKNRPHVTFHMDGNGKFFRFSGYNCTVESEMRLNGNLGVITPVSSKISFPDSSECLRLSYSVLADGCIALDDLQFISG